MSTKKDFIDVILNGLEPVTEDGAQKKDEKCISFFLKKGYHQKFGELQDLTGHKFGKNAQDLLMEFIDRAYEKFNPKAS